MQRRDIEIWATENLKRKQPVGAKKYLNKRVCFIIKGWVMCEGLQATIFVGKMLLPQFGSLAQVQQNDFT